MTDISANSAEKPRRGRPPAGGHVVREMFEQMGVFVECTSPRGKQDRFYATHALGVLTRCDEAADFAWLADRAAIDRQAPQAWRPTIMAELGRIDDDEAMRAVARQICRIKPKARDAVRMIRAWRLGKFPPKANVAELTRVIARAIRDYRTVHPDLTKHMGWSPRYLERARRKLKVRPAADPEQDTEEQAIVREAFDDAEAGRRPQW